MTDPTHRPETEVESAWTRVWRTLLVRGIVLVLVVAALGMGIGWLAAGSTGLAGERSAEDSPRSSSSSPS